MLLLQIDGHYNCNIDSRELKSMKKEWTPVSWCSCQISWKSGQFV